MKKVLEKFVNDKRIKKEPGIGFDQIEKRLKRAKLDLENAKILLPRDQIGAFRMAYDAMLQSGLSLVLSFGYRPAVKGFHKTVVDFSNEILGKDFSVITKQFDQMRRNRHDAIYDIVAISNTEAKESIETAGKLIKAVVANIRINNPQKKLL